MTLKVGIQRQGDRAMRVSLAGELDMATGPKAERALREAESQSPSLLIVDLRRLDFMDSTGLHLLLKAMQRARDQGRRLVLIRGPRAVQMVFTVTALEDSFEFIDEPSSEPPDR